MRVPGPHVAIALVLVAAGARAESFRIPPYLSYSGGSALALTWSPTEGRASTTVQLFRGGALATTVEAARDAGVLKALLPMTCGSGERLSYRVEGMDAPEEIAPLPCADEDVVRFGFLTDTQTDYEMARRFAERVATSGGAFVLHGGDMVQVGGSDEEWRRFLVAMAPFAARRPLVVAPGNHEFWLDGKGERLRRFFGVDDEAGDYLFSAGPVDVVVLSTSFVEERARRNRQLAWLRETLAGLRAKDPGRWLVVLFHHPPYSRGVAHSGLYWRKEHEVLQRYYVPAFEEHGVDLVLSGHTHLYERSEKAGVTYVVGGAAGGVMGWLGGKNPFSRLSLQVRTFSFLEASRARLVLITEGLDGEEIDRVELQRSDRS